MAARLRDQKLAELITSDGEVHTVVQERWAGKSYGRQFVIVFTETMALAAEKIGQGMTLRVLLLLPKHLNFTDFLPLPTREVGAKLHTNPGNVSRCMNQLFALGIVEREGRGPVTRWRLSTDWGWNGTADQYHAMRGGRLKGKKPPVPLPAVAQSRIIHIMERQHDVR